MRSREDIRKEVRKEIKSLAKAGKIPNNKWYINDSIEQQTARIFREERGAK